MTKAYIEKLCAILRGALSRGFKSNKLEVKRFFSGAAVYANGKICMTLTPVGFALKLPEGSRISLMKQKGAKHLRYFPKAPIKKEFVILPKNMVNDSKVLNHWMKKSIEYVTV